VTTTNEALRAWALHLAIWTAGAVVLIAVIWVSAWTIHFAGVAIGLTLLAALVLTGLATVTWWATGRTRP
jgi:predicted lysophospholipase L1 biosynthesis ABC-type transport system permease subunit